MPTYSYRCTECGTAFDVQQSFTDDSLTVCPSCSGVLRKVFSPVGVSFTGSGFYRNDSREAAKPKKSKSGSESSEKSSPKVAEKASTSESKPAATPAKTAPATSSASSASNNKTSH